MVGRSDRIRVVHTLICWVGWVVFLCVYEGAVDEGREIICLLPD